MGRYLTFVLVVTYLSIGHGLVTQIQTEEVSDTIVSSNSAQLLENQGVFMISVSEEEEEEEEIPSAKNRKKKPKRV